MVSFNIDKLRNEDAYLIIKIDLTEFAISIAQIDGVGEFDNEFQNNTKLKFLLGNYHQQDEIIPILNLKNYLQCPSERFNRTTQSRILFVKPSEKIFNIPDTVCIGVGIDAIVSLYKVATSKRIRNTNKFISKDLQCFQCNSSIEINSNLYPILDLIKLIDFTSLKSTLEKFIPEKF